MLDSPCLPQWADLQRKAWVKLLGSPTRGQQLGEPLRLPELGQRGFLQMHPHNAPASAGLFQKAGAGLFARFSQFRSSLTGR